DLEHEQQREEQRKRQGYGPNPAPHEPVTRLRLDADVMFEAQCREQHQKRNGESSRDVLLDRGPCRKERLIVNCTGEIAGGGDHEELECNDLYEQSLEPTDHRRGRGVTQRRGGHIAPQPGFATLKLRCLLSLCGRYIESLTFIQHSCCGILVQLTK